MGAQQFVAPVECELRMKAVMKILEGNGEPGLVADVRTIREDMAAARGAADARHKYTMILLACLTIAVALMAIPGIAYSFHVGDLKVPSIFQSKQSDKVYTVRMEKSPQLAKE
jgi:hypothetical protein